MTAIATAKSPATKSAQSLARQAEDSHRRAISRTRTQIEKARQGRAAEPELGEVAQAQATGATSYPMPRLGVFRCKRKKCQNCAVGTCKASREEARTASSCPCHQAQRCTYWEDNFPCATSYAKAPPTQTAIRAWHKAPSNPSPSISSSVSTVTPDKLRNSIQSLQRGAGEFQQEQYALIQQIEDKEAALDVSMQGLLGLYVDALRQHLVAALAESDDLLEVAEEVVGKLEEQDLGGEKLGDALQAEHLAPGAGQDRVASLQQFPTKAPGSAPGGPTSGQQQYPPPAQGGQQYKFASWA